MATRINHTPPPDIEYVADLRFNIMLHIQENTTLRFGMIEGFHRVAYDIFINEAWEISEKPFYFETPNECRISHQEREQCYITPTTS